MRTLQVPAQLLASIDLHARQPLSRQAPHESVELRLRQAPGVEPSRGAAHSEAVVHAQLDAGRARVGEQVAVMRLVRAKQRG